MGGAHTIWMINVVFSMAKPIFDVLLDASLHPLALGAMHIGRGAVIYYQQAFCFFFLSLLRFIINKPFVSSFCLFSPKIYSLVLFIFGILIFIFYYHYFRSLFQFQFYFLTLLYNHFSI